MKWHHVVNHDDTWGLQWPLDGDMRQKPDIAGRRAGGCHDSLPREDPLDRSLGRVTPGREPRGVGTSGDLVTKPAVAASRKLPPPAIEPYLTLDRCHVDSASTGINAGGHKPIVASVNRELNVIHARQGRQSAGEPVGEDADPFGRRQRATVGTPDSDSH